MDGLDVDEDLERASGIEDVGEARSAVVSPRSADDLGEPRGVNDLGVKGRGAFIASPETIVPASDANGVVCGGVGRLIQLPVGAALFLGGCLLTAVSISTLIAAMIRRYSFLC